MHGRHKGLFPGDSDTSRRRACRYRAPGSRFSAVLAEKSSGDRLAVRRARNTIELADNESDAKWSRLYDSSVAYEEELADRIRELVGRQPELSEQKMFGGLAFLISGNMAVAASGRGGLMVRVDPVEGERLISTSAAEPMEMRGREMLGWLRVSSGEIRTKRQLSRWVKLGTAYAASLPSKQSRRIPGTQFPPSGQ